MDESGMQLVLPSGRRVAHRSMDRFYKQKFKPEDVRINIGFCCFAVVLLLFCRFLLFFQCLFLTFSDRCLASRLYACQQACQPVPRARLARQDARGEPGRSLVPPHAGVPPHADGHPHKHAVQAARPDDAVLVPQEAKCMLFGYDHLFLIDMYSCTFLRLFVAGAACPRLALAFAPAICE